MLLLPALKDGTVPLGDALAVSYKTGMFLPYYPVFMTLRYLPKVGKNVCPAQMIIAILVIIPHHWKQPSCSLANRKIIVVHSDN